MEGGREVGGVDKQIRQQLRKIKREIPWSICNYLRSVFVVFFSILRIYSN
jgi:hypothetical protein